MENFEIFLNYDHLNITIFSLLFLLVATYHAAKERSLMVAVSFFAIATILNFCETYVEAEAVELFKEGYFVERYVMVELLLLFISMMLIIITSLIFLSIQVKTPLFIASGIILSALGCGAIILFTVIKPAGDVVNKMLTVFPLAAYIFFAIGLTGRFSQRYARGYVLAFVLTIVNIIIMLKSVFFEVENIVWYTIN